MRQLRSIWTLNLVAIIVVALVIATAMCLLPDDPYQRYSTLDNTIQNRVRWIYERIHFDPTPIDVVVIGPSRSGAAVSSPRLEQDLRTAGYPLHSVNFSLPENGRNLNWVILEQLFEIKHPRLLVLGVIEKPGRFGHPAYKYLASTSDVVDPAYFGNLNYLSDLVYLPFRQLKLFTARLLPSAFDLPSKFESHRYAGSNVETTVDFTAGDGTVVHREQRSSKADLFLGKTRYERGVHAPYLGPERADLEFGDERSYLRRIASLAHTHGTRLVFLFLPYYSGPTSIQEGSFYRTIAPIIDASFLAHHDEWYSDVAHLNHSGALILTDWIAPQIALLAVAPVQDCAVR